MITEFLIWLFQTVVTGFVTAIIVIGNERIFKRPAEKVVNHVEEKFNQGLNGKQNNA